MIFLCVYVFILMMSVFVPSYLRLESFSSPPPPPFAPNLVVFLLSAWCIYKMWKMRFQFFSSAHLKWSTLLLKLFFPVEQQMLCAVHYLPTVTQGILLIVCCLQ